MYIKKVTSNKSNFHRMKNTSYIKCLALVLFLDPLLNFINVGLVLLFNLGSTKALTLSVYVVVLMLCMYKVFKFRDFTSKKIIIYIFSIIFYLLNYIFFEQSRLFLLRDDMILIYCFYLPVAIFVVSSIDNWLYAIDIFKLYSFVAILMALTGLLLFNYEDSIGYMSFSYAILPFVIFSYFSFREKNCYIDLLIFMIGLLSITVFGARAPIIFVLTFILAYEFLFLEEIKLYFKVIYMSFYSICLMVFILFYKQFLNFIIRIAGMINSRFLTSLLAGKIAVSIGRSKIYREAFKTIKNMGLTIYGLFGDRLIVPSSYVHNIFLEMLLSFGLIFGTIISIKLLFFIIKSFFFTTIEYKKIVICFTSALFLRFLISGSFVIEGNFYLYIAILYSINHIRIRSKEGEINENTIYSVTSTSN